MKRVISLVLCLMLVLGLAATASAATVINETNHSYAAYQIFRGTQSAGSVSLGDVQWGEGVDGVALLEELKAKYDIYDSCATAAGVAAILAADSSAMDKDTDAKNFANVAAKHLTNPTETIIAGDNTVDLPTGYYLLVDITDIDEAYDASNPALLQVTNAADVKIAKKYTVPTPEKKIITEAKALADDAEYSIGDKVEFQLKATMANNLGDYDTYKLVFHDKMSAGLSFNNDVVVTYKGNAVSTSLYTVVVPTAPATELADGCTFEVVITDVKLIEGMASSSDIYVTYSATLNEDAVIDGAGNPNELRLEFSNNPNWKPTPDDGDDTNDKEPTGITPWDEVVVYTTEIQITKKDGTTKQILTGAEFEITGTGANVVIVDGAKFEAYAAGEELVAGNQYWLLKDDTYTSTNPTTAGINTDNYQDMVTVYKLVDLTEAKNTKASVQAKAYVDKDGNLKFTGLGVGEYTIKETVTPAGYNTIQDIKVTITWDSINGFQYSWTGGANGATNHITVNNYQGSTLPETGGVGTTLFYVIGGLMFAASAVLLVTKKRMTAE